MDLIQYRESLKKNSLEDGVKPNSGKMNDLKIHEMMWKFGRKYTGKKNVTQDYPVIILFTYNLRTYKIESYFGEWLIIR